MSTKAKEIEAALAEIPMFDVHTHLVGGRLSARGLHDVLLYHMLITELHAAGCASGRRLTEYPQWPSRDEAHARLEEAVAFLPQIRNTSLFHALRTLLADLYGWNEPITRANWRRLDAQIRERADDRGWQWGILDRLKIRRTVTEYVRREGGQDDDRLQYSLEWGMFARTQWGEFDTPLWELERCWGEPITGAAPIGGERPRTARTIRSVQDVQAAMAHYLVSIPYSDLVSTAAGISTDIDYVTVQWEA